MDRSPLRDCAENLARINYFRAKPEFIMRDYITARDTAQLATKYPLLNVFQLRIMSVRIVVILLLLLSLL